MGGQKPTMHGGSVELVAGAGMTPCVRRCRFALDRTPKDRVQPGNPHGKAEGGESTYAVFRTGLNSRFSLLCVFICVLNPLGL